MVAIISVQKPGRHALSGFESMSFKFFISFDSRGGGWWGTVFFFEHQFIQNFYLFKQQQVFEGFSWCIINLFIIYLFILDQHFVNK